MGSPTESAMKIEATKVLNPHESASRLWRRDWMTLKTSIEDCSDGLNPKPQGVAGLYWRPNMTASCGHAGQGGGRAPLPTQL